MRTDIPVAIKNFADLVGGFPNSDLSAESSLKYFRRFFLVDTISAVDKNKNRIVFYFICFLLMLIVSLIC